ncbi:MAG: hypothetical protein DDT35_00137 [Firmicutes bacterium]|nr:hypothetical protein [Bacillota bacterium]
MDIRLNALHQRNAKSGGLAGAGLCLADDILVVERIRDHLGLNGGHLLKTHLSDSLQHLRT